MAGLLPTRSTTDTNTFADINSLSAPPVVTVSNADYTIVDSSTTVLSSLHVTTGSTTRTVTLPTVADNTGREITIVKVDSGSGGVTIDGEGSETIDGSLTQSITQQFQAITVKSDGSTWYIKSRNSSNSFLEAATAKTGDYTLVNADFSNDQIKTFILYGASLPGSDPRKYTFTLPSSLTDIDAQEVWIINGDAEDGIFLEINGNGINVAGQTDIPLVGQWAGVKIQADNTHTGEYHVTGTIPSIKTDYTATYELDIGTIDATTVYSSWCVQDGPKLIVNQFYELDWTGTPTVLRYSYPVAATGGVRGGEPVDTAGISMGTAATQKTSATTARRGAYTESSGTRVNIRSYDDTVAFPTNDTGFRIKSKGQWELW